MASDTYAVSGILHASSAAVLYRGIRIADGRAVVLKVLPAEHRPIELERLKNEYEIARALGVPSSASPVVLATYQGSPALVMADFGGEPLDRSLGAPMDVGLFLALAVRIAGAVADIHHGGIVHKDVKPENILVHPTTGDVKITDFGLASRIPCQRPAIGSARRIEGSLPYMSPEQTGRTNRTVDQRSDLYSLGVTFYEMLTGRLPFDATDPLEWVHCHIARSPTPPADVVPRLPAALSASVMKLLAKEAEDRYESARGLRRDLERCLEEWRSRGEIRPFRLGQHDASDRFQIPQKLYGRSEETAALLSAFERVVAGGTPELALVSGYSGIGKSSLIHELHEPIVRERGFLASGKFEQYKRHVPYSTIVQAFTELVGEILAGSEKQIAAWRERIQGAVGSSGQLIIDVIPPVELVIGRQPPAPALPPAEAQNRFRIVFRRFIGAFARKEHPLALFLDDLQWADSASLALVQDLVTHPEARHLFLVGAYRDSEVSLAHPLMSTLHEARKAGARISSIVLGPLSSDDLGALVGGTLHRSREEVAPLADLVHAKTGGNPFFAIQFLTALHDDRLIAFDPAAGLFRWDVAQIREKKLTDNVVDLMVGKLLRLPSATQEALKKLACLGTSVEVSVLSAVLGQAVDETHAHLDEAVRAGLLLRSGSTYKLLHDRVEEAAYSLIPAASRPAEHLQIGRLLLSHLSEAALEERIFDVVGQLDRGVALITAPCERESLSRLCFRAGKKAKAAIAYATARKCLAQAAELLPPDAWSARYQETFELYLELSECEFLVGEFGRADELFNSILEQARSDTDRARVHSLRTKLYQVSGRYEDGVRVALSALQLFGVTCPAEGPEIQAAFDAENREIQRNLRGRSIADLKDGPIAVDPEVRAVLGLLVDAMPCAYIARPAIFPLLVVKALNISLRHGNTEASCFAYSVYGLMLVSIFGDIPAAFELSEMSLRLNEKLGDARLKGMLLHIHGDHINFWHRHFSTGTPILGRAFGACLEAGDLVYAGFLAFETVWQAVEKGDPLDDVLEASQKHAAFARQSHNEPVYQTIRLEQQLVACLKGKTRGPASFDDEDFDETESLASITRATFGCGVVFFHIMKQIAAFTYGRYAEALASASEAAATLAAAMAMPIEATHHFYHALTLAALHAAAPAAEQQDIAKALAAKLEKLALWADNCPENYENRRALVAAEVARIEGRDLEAMHLYERAIQSARENGFIQNEALAREIAARFYRARGFDTTAMAYLREARACYVRWGADGKVAELDRETPELAERRPLPPALSAAEHIDALSVVKASQAISGEIVLDRLLSKLVEVVLEQAGAQRGYVILHRDGDPTIEAEASVDDKGAVAVKLLRALPVASSPLLPASIVNYVGRTRAMVLLPNAVASRFAADEYIARTRPKSVLCLPIRRQSELMGLLYLENNLVTGAFTTDAIEVLELLTSQAAISLENARLHRQAVEALRLRDEFLTVASHELYTPMTSLKLALQSMLRATRQGRPLQPEALDEHVRLALRQEERLNHLVDQLLDVSKIEAGRLVLELVEVDLGALTHEVARRFAPDLARAGSTVSIQGDAVVSGLWDPSRIDQVITNLLANAIKFGAGQPIEITVGAEGGRARLVVQDHGIGVDPAQQNRIFARFGRAVSDKHYGGLGLGLHICRSVVEAHAGSIRAESRPGAGATFIVELPCAGPPRPASEAVRG